MAPTDTEDKDMEAGTVGTATAAAWEAAAVAWPAE